MMRGRGQKGKRFITSLYPNRQLIDRTGPQPSTKRGLSAAVCARDSVKTLQQTCPPGDTGEGKCSKSYKRYQCVIGFRPRLLSLILNPNRQVLLPLKIITLNVCLCSGKLTCFMTDSLKTTRGGHLLFTLRVLEGQNDVPVICPPVARASKGEYVHVSHLYFYKLYSFRVEI